MKFLRGVAVLSVAVLGLVGVASLFGYDKFPWSGTGNDETVLLKSVQDVSRLESAVGTFELVVDTGDTDEDMPDIISGRRTLFVATGTVDAYVDLAGITGEDLTFSADGKSVTLRLPEAELGKPNIDHEASKVYREDRGVVDRIADVFGSTQQTQLFVQAERDMAAAAEKSDLRQRASENAQSTLKVMFASLGLEVNFLEKGTK